MHARIFCLVAQEPAGLLVLILHLFTGLRNLRFISGTVIAMALTSQEPRAGFPLTLELPASGLPKRSWVKISQIRTLAVERIGDCLGRIDEPTLSRILEGLGDILGKLA